MYRRNNDDGWVDNVNTLIGWYNWLYIIHLTQINFISKTYYKLALSIKIYDFRIKDNI